MKLRLVVVFLSYLAAAGCDGPGSSGTPCDQDSDCEPGWTCGENGTCVQECHGNDECPAGEVCMADTHTCESGAADADGDADSDADSDCPDPGTATCVVDADCAGEGAPCACLDLLGYGGYCYPDCGECDSPWMCIEDGCLYLGPLIWEFNLRIIDPDIGGGDYIELDLELDTVDVTFVYAYAYVDDTYGYVWINAIAYEGQGGYLLQTGVKLSAYDVGDLSMSQMQTSVYVLKYDDWYGNEATGLAIGVDPGQAVLELTQADTEVGGRVKGTLNLPLAEYRYDIAY